MMQLKYDLGEVMRHRYNVLLLTVQKKYSDESQSTSKEHNKDFKTDIPIYKDQSFIRCFRKLKEKEFQLNHL